MKSKHTGSKLNKRLEAVKRDIEHSKLKYVLFNVFSRENHHGFVFVSSDLSLSRSSDDRVSWDIVIAKIDEEKEVISPIFIEVKSTIGKGNIKSDVIEELEKKVNLTKSLLNSEEGTKFIINQLAGKEISGPKLSIENPEYVIFFPSYDAKKFINYLNSSTKVDSSRIPLIVWSLEVFNSSDHCIQITYDNNSGVSTCRNCESDKDNKVCLCLHSDSRLMEWLRNSKSQSLPKNFQIMPSFKGFGDTAINIVALLSMGQLKAGRPYTDSEIVNGIKGMYEIYHINPTLEELERIKNVMIDSKILLRNRGSPSTYKVNSTISKTFGNQNDLVYHVVEKVVENSNNSNQVLITNFSDS